MEQELLTSSEAATYLGLTRQRVDQLGQEGALPRQRMGHFWVYQKRDLDRWRSEGNRVVGRPKSGEKLQTILRGPEVVAA